MPFFENAPLEFVEMIIHKNVIIQEEEIEDNENTDSEPKKTQTLPHLACCHLLSDFSRSLMELMNILS